jgi:hypothetical protein
MPGLASASYNIKTMAKFKLGIISAIVVIGAAILVWQQHQAQLAAHEENRALRQQVEQLVAENDRLSNQVAHVTAAPVAGGDQERELLRLRNEVGNLRRQAAEAARVQAANAAKAPPPAETTAPPPEDEAKKAGIAKMNFARVWFLACLQYSEKNQDQFPTTFEQAAPFLSEEAKAEAANKYGTSVDQFEIVYQGPIKSLPSPQNVIVMREKQPWQTPDGSWMRAYGFADGHAEVHRTADANYAAWEAQHVAAPPTGAQPGQ